MLMFLLKKDECRCRAPPTVAMQLHLCCRHQVIERRMRDTYLSSTVSSRCTNNCDNCMHEADKMDNITSTMQGAFKEMCKKKNAGERMNETALKECFQTLPATRYAHQKATPSVTLTIAESNDKRWQEAIVCTCEGRAHSCALVLIGTDRGAHTFASS